MSIREQFAKTPANEGQADNRAIRPAQDEVTSPMMGSPAGCEDPNWEAKKQAYEAKKQDWEPKDTCEVAKPAAANNPLQGRNPYESMSYDNDLTDTEVERIIEVHAQQIRTGFRRKEVSAKWLARVLFRSNKTLCERYDRGTKVSEICNKELTAESDTLRDKLLELTPSARAKLIAELQGLDK